MGEVCAHAERAQPVMEGEIEFGRGRGERGGGKDRRKNKGTERGRWLEEGEGRGVYGERG